MFGRVLQALSSPFRSIERPAEEQPLPLLNEAVRILFDEDAQPVRRAMRRSANPSHAPVRETMRRLLDEDAQVRARQARFAARSQLIEIALLQTQLNDIIPRGGDPALQLAIQISLDSEPWRPAVEGLSEESVQRYTSVCTLSQENVDALPADGKRCCVCLEDFEVGHEVSRLVCLHQLHKHCADMALRNSGQCPLCRTAVLGHAD